MMGKKAKMFVQDKEITSMSNFSFSNFEKPERGTIEFHGIYTPQNDEMTGIINNSAPFTANVYLPNDEIIKDVLVKLTVKEREIIIEPVDQEVQDRIKKTWFGEVNK